jgi:uncharacterized membrane protein
MGFGGTPVEFESDYPLDESVARLSSATQRARDRASREQAAVGRVDERKVVLVRVIPFVNNSFKPVFTGRFEETGSRVVLRGSFGMHVSVKVFACVWFGGLVAFTVLLALRARDGSDAGKMALFCAGMAGAGVLLFAFARWFARNDPAWLSAVIRGALSRPRS